jgi:hypothetical protein
MAPNNWALDNCDPNPVYDFTETQLSGSCAHTYTLERKWDSADRTGNTISHTQLVTVEDTEAPVYIENPIQSCVFPADGNYAVFENAISLFDVMDNCGTVTLEIVWYNSAADTLYVKGERNQGVQGGRTYSLYAIIEDECANSKTIKKTFWVPYTSEAMEAAEDTACTAPTASSAPGAPTS